MCLVLMAAPASAEWYADVYAGQSLTLNDDVTVHSPAGLGIYRDVEFDQSLSSADDSGGIWIACPFSAWASTLRFTPSIGPQQFQVDGCVPSARV